MTPISSRETRPITRRPQPQQLGEHRYDLGPVEGCKAVAALDSSHLVMLSHPEEVADLIRKSVAAVGEQSRTGSTTSGRWSTGGCATTSTPTQPVRW